MLKLIASFLTVNDYDIQTFLLQLHILKAHGHVFWPKNITYEFFGLSQCVLTSRIYCENLKKFLCVVFEKIKFKVSATSLYGNGITI